MADRNAQTMILRVLSFFILVYSAESSIGVNYRSYGDNMPTATQAVALLKKSGITQARIYDTNYNVLTAFQGSNIQLVVGVRNDEIVTIGQDNATAYKWVQDHIVPHASKCNITGIAVGNEVLSYDSSEAVLLLPAMKLLHTALVSYGLDSMVKVTTPSSTDLLVTKFPPSSGAFGSNLSTMAPMLDFLFATGSFFMLNVYPHKEYQHSQQNISLDFALFQPNPGVVDSATGFLYTNSFDSLLDAAYAALAKLNHTGLNIVVSESGWPSLGEAYEKGLSPENAQTYNANLVKHALSKIGSPGKPGVLIITYVYELFNEKKRQGSLSTRNMGLFNPDMAPVYPVDLSGSSITLVNPTTPPAASTTRTWCVAKQDASQITLQAALDYACGLGRADCLPIQPGQACFLPNTKASHASFAMNSYYQKHANQRNACNFQGTATITTKDPSSKSCIYPSSTHLTSAQISPADHLAPASTWLLLSAAFVLLFGTR